MDTKGDEADGRLCYLIIGFSRVLCFDLDNLLMVHPIRRRDPTDASQRLASSKGSSPLSQLMPQVFKIIVAKFGGRRVLAEFAPSSAEFPLYLWLLRTTTGENDNRPTTRIRTTPPKWVSILPTTSTRREFQLRAKRCWKRCADAESAALGHWAQTTHTRTTDTDTIHSNGHRKAPKSADDYKLLLHKVDFLAELVGRWYWTSANFTTALQLPCPQDRVQLQPGCPPSSEAVKNASVFFTLEQVAMLRFELY